MTEIRLALWLVVVCVAGLLLDSPKFGNVLTGMVVTAVSMWRVGCLCNNWLDERAARRKEQT